MCRYVWDARNRKRCMHVFSDDGAISCSALAVSHDDRYVACGSDSGVVNIYNDECYRSGTPSPLKAIMNLTTVVHRLAFHPKNDVLAISSRTKKQAFRLFHVPSLTTFQNWPPMGTQLGYVNALSFSPGGGYLTTVARPPSSREPDVTLHLILLVPHATCAGQRQGQGNAVSLESL